MIYLLGLISFLLVFTAEAKVGNSSEFQFCRDTKECLLFDVICKTDDFEVRHYDDMTVVSTTESGIFMELATLRAYRRLMQYFRGANENGEKIDVTAPIIVKIEENKEFWQGHEFTVTLVLPAKYQAKAPRPKNKKVKIIEMEHMDMYVKSYRGWMTTKGDQNKAKQLAADLDSERAQYKTGVHYAVAYDRPMKMFNRYNEVWYLAEGSPVCASGEHEH